MKLKNCPFCDSSSICLTEAYGRKNASVFAECLDCGATGAPFAIGHDAEAVNAWNTRTGSTCEGCAEDTGISNSDVCEWCERNPFYTDCYILKAVE